MSGSFNPHTTAQTRRTRHQRLAWVFILCAAALLFWLLQEPAIRRPDTPSVLPSPTAPEQPTAPAPAEPAPVPVPTPAPAPTTPRPAPPQPAPQPPAANASQATTPRAYRKDAARHLYAKNAARIYNGPLPPLLYAVGVLQVHLDKQGRIRSLHWLRAPSHAPEVVREIERTVRAAAPYPAPTQLGQVTYTDTWLWDKSGRFQLDTLTEGQQ